MKLCDRGCKLERFASRWLRLDDRQGSGSQFRNVDYVIAAFAQRSHHLRTGSRGALLLNSTNVIEIESELKQAEMP